MRLGGKGSGRTCTNLIYKKHIAASGFIKKQLVVNPQVNFGDCLKTYFSPQIKMIHLLCESDFGISATTEKFKKP